MSVDLGTMFVAFATDLSGLQSGVAQAQAILDEVASSATNAGASLSALTVNPSNMESGLDAVQAKVTDLESQVDQARTALQQMQDEEAAGGNVAGIADAAAQLATLEAQAQDAAASLAALQASETNAGDSASTMAGEMDQAAEAASQAESAGSSFGGGLSGLGNSLSMGIMNMQILAQTATQVGNALLGPAASAETTQLSFTTLLHSTTAAKDEMVALNTFASGTPMQTQWIDTAASKMLAFGFSNKAVIPDITAIGDSLSSLGKLSDASLSSIVDIFGKIQASGKITGGDMMQLSNWGIPAWQALSNAMKLPIPELQKMVSAGLVPASQALPALQSGMESIFGGGMQKQANTFNGLVSTFQSNWQIAMAALGTPVLKELEPQISKLAAAFGTKSFQDFATNTGVQIGNTVVKLVDGFSKLVGMASSVVSFFQQNHTALAALEIVGIAVGGAVIGSLLVGFYAWAVAAGIAAAATLAATWPILLIGAGVALVIAGIVLAVQHWGDISKWLQGAWANVSGFFGGILKTIGGFFEGLWKAILNLFGGVGTWFQDRFTEAKNGIQSVFGNVGSWFGDRWKDISGAAQAGVSEQKNIFTGAISWTQNAWSTGVADVAKSFEWLYNHNYYFKNLVDNIVAIFTSVKDFLTTTWTNLTSWIGNVWTTIAGYAQVYFTLISFTVQEKILQVQQFITTIWNTISGYIQSVWTLIAGYAQVYFTAISFTVQQKILQVQQFLTGIWTTISTWIQTQWAKIAGFADTAWKAVSTVFSTIWTTYLSPPLTNVWNSISGWFNNIINTAGSWGHNLIQSFINGINGMLSSVGQSASNIAAQIAKYLGFHSPAEAGPGADLMNWGPGLVKGFSQGMLSALPELQAAINVTAQPLALLSIPQGASTFPAAYGGSSAAMAQAGSGNTTGEQHFHIYIGNEEIAHYVGTAQMKETRRRTGMKM